jgi:hypothetical protein
MSTATAMVLSTAMLVAIVAIVARVIMAAMIVWLHAPYLTSVARMPAYAEVSRTDMDAAGRITKGRMGLPAVNFE